MRKTLLTLLALLFCAAGVHAQPLYDLRYDVTTGSLTINTFGNPLFAYSIKGPGAFAIDDGFFEGNHQLIVGTGGPAFSAATSSDDELSQTDFNSWTVTEHNLGSVLPTGLDSAGVSALISEAWYVKALGTNGAPDEFVDFNIVVVPEPTSALLFAAGCAIILSRRRNG